MLGSVSWLVHLLIWDVAFADMGLTAGPVELGVEFVVAAVVVAEASFFAVAVVTGCCCGELAMGPLDTGVGVCR